MYVHFFLNFLHAFLRYLTIFHFLFKQPTMATGIRPQMMTGPVPGGPFAMGSMAQPAMPIRPAANQQLDPFGAL